MCVKARFVFVSAQQASVDDKKSVSGYEIPAGTFRAAQWMAGQVAERKGRYLFAFDDVGWVVRDSLPYEVAYSRQKTAGDQQEDYRK